MPMLWAFSWFYDCDKKLRGWALGKVGRHGTQRYPAQQWHQETDTDSTRKGNPLRSVVKCCLFGSDPLVWYMRPKSEFF